MTKRFIILAVLASGFLGCAGQATIGSTGGGPVLELDSGLDPCKQLETTLAGYAQATTDLVNGDINSKAWKTKVKYGVTVGQAMRWISKETAKTHETKQATNCPSSDDEAGG